jgi:hypothetical protein
MRFKMDKNYRCYCLAVQIMRGPRKFLEYSKNSELLFISGPSYIFENVNYHCSKRREEKVTSISILKSYSFLSTVKESNDGVFSIPGLLYRYKNCRGKKSDLSITKCSSGDYG